MRRETTAEVMAWLVQHGVRPLAVRLVAWLDCSVWRVAMPGRGGDLCVRIFRAGHDDAAQIDSELAWLQALHQAGLHVPGPLPDAQGQLRRTWQPDPSLAPRHAALLRWLPGRMLDHGLRAVHLRRLGHLVATMHDGADRLAAAGGLASTRAAHNADLEAWAEGRRRLAIPGPPGLPQAAQHAARALRRYVPSGGPQAPHWGFIHGDLHLWNLLFHQGQAGAIDFSDSGWGWRMQDLASTLQFIRHPLAGHADHRRAEPALRDALLDGYAQRRPLPSDALTQIDMLVAARMLNTLQWIADDWPDVNHRSWGPRFIAEVETVLRHAAGG